MFWAYYVWLLLGMNKFSFLFFETFIYALCALNKAETAFSSLLDNHDAIPICISEYVGRWLINDFLLLLFMQNDRQMYLNKKCQCLERQKLNLKCAKFCKKCAMFFALLFSIFVFIPIHFRLINSSSKFVNTGALQNPFRVKLSLCTLPFHTPFGRSHWTSGTKINRGQRIMRL